MVEEGKKRSSKAKQKLFSTKQQPKSSAVNQNQNPSQNKRTEVGEGAVEVSRKRKKRWS